MARQAYNLTLVATAACVFLLAGCGGGREPRLEGDLFVSDGRPQGGSAEAEAEIRPLLGEKGGRHLLPVGPARQGDAAASPEGACAQKVPDPLFSHATVAVDYPLEGSVFPPEIVAPTFLWHDDNAIGEWLIDLAFQSTQHHIYALTRGARPKDEIDPQCVTETNVYRETPYQASARGWTPAEAAWTLIKRHSTESDTRVVIYGLRGDGPSRRVVSRGAVTIRTSKDPVGALIFYRDVPLMPTATESGVIQPIAASALPMIKWRLRDLSKPGAPVVMEFIPTCANCHSFSRDGRTLAMDMDGPAGDKGAHVVAPVSPRMVVDGDMVFTWNSFKSGRQGLPSYGLFPQVSPDGRYVVATILETLYVRNYMDYGFLQTFYPTRGMLAFYARESREIKLLPGADDPDYVQTNPVWSPDGKTIAFLRARARDVEAAAPLARAANDPDELQIKYDLYTIPFNEGRGGVAAPLPGASNNGMSNSFPKFSPDGRWIVFVQAKNGLLMRPDSRLYIVPAQGGEPRLMKCNTARMNSWHSWSPNGRWLVFSSKCNRPYTQMFLTHVDDSGNDTPAVLVPNSTAANRAANLPEFAGVAPGDLVEITTPAVEYRRRLDRGKQLVDEGRVEEGIAELRRSVEMKGDYAPSHHELATALGLRGRHDEAVAEFNRALAINPRYFLAHANLAIVLSRMGRFDQAVEHCRKALEINPDYYLIHNEWGTALCGMGRNEEAVEHFRKVLAAEPGQFETQVNLGALLVELHRADEALEVLDKAVKTNPRSFPARQNLGLALNLKGRYAEAVEQFRTVLELNGQFSPAHREWAVALLNLGRPAEAVEHLRKALETSPRFANARITLAKVLATHPDAKARDGKDAVQHAEIACDDVKYGDAEFVDTLAAAYAESGRFDDATRTAAKALDLARAARDPDGIGAAQIQAHLEMFRKKQPLRHEGRW